MQQIDRTTASSPFWKRELGRSDRLSLKELNAFTIELGTLMKSGLTLDSAFRIMSGSGVSPKISRMASGLLKDVLAGMQLSEAMAQRPDVFSPDYRAILAAGEASGVSASVLQQIAELLTRRLELRNKVLAALVYPIILILMSLASIAVIVFVLIPSISPVFVDAGLPLPGILQFFEDVQDRWMTVVLTIVTVATASIMLWRKAKGHTNVMRRVDRLKCALPVVGRFIQARHAGAFARALGTLVLARVPLTSAMQTARGLVTNRHLNALYEMAIKRVPEGTPLHRAFEGGGLFPAASLRLIAVGEESGQLGPMLVQVAAAIENDLQRRVERIVGLLTPALTLIIGGSVGGLIMHVMKAVMSINDLAFQ